MKKDTHNDNNKNYEDALLFYPEQLDSIDFMQYAPDDVEAEGDSATYCIAWLQRNAGDEFIAQYGTRILGVTNWFFSMFSSRGLSRDDVFQTACLASLKIDKECQGAEERWLAFRMKHRLPMYVWREIEELLPQGCGFDPQELLLSMPERQTRRWVQMLEAEDMLDRALSGPDLVVAKALLLGRTQTEIADELGMTQPGVSVRIRAIRKKLHSVFLGPDYGDPDDRDIFPNVPGGFDIE